MANRIIKFRVWDSISNSWINKEGMTLSEIFEWGGSGEDSSVMYQLTFTQFTGLKDKNGKEIYEGDILKSEAGSIYMNKYTKLREWLSKVVFKEGKFTTEPILPDTVSYDIHKDDEVIGNVFEDKELLNGI